MDDDALLGAVLTAPDDDAPRLAYARAMDERGDPRGDLIRVQCELARLAPGAASRRAELETRQRALLASHGKAFAARLLSLVSEARVSGGDEPTVIGCRFRRGFVEAITTTAWDLIYQADDLFALSPIAEVNLVFSRVEELARVKGRHLAALRTLSLCHGAVSDEEAAQLAAIPHLAALRALVLSGNRIGPAGLAALSRSSNLARLGLLDLSGNPLGDEGVRRLAESALLPALFSLELAGSGIGRSGVGALAEAQGAMGLSLLDLSFNDPRLEGVQAIAGSAFLSRLTQLSLSGNGLFHSGAAALAESTTLRSLSRLRIASCDVGAEGARALVRGEGLRGLSCLDVSRNFLGPSGAAALCLGFSSLVELDLSGNAIGDEGARALSEAEHMTQLSRLVLRGNGIGEAGARSLAGARHLKSLVELRIARNNPLGPSALSALGQSPLPALRAAVAGARPWSRPEERLFNPSRQTLPQARGAIDGLRSPDEALRALAAAGVIPASWVDDPARSFLRQVRDPCPGCRGEGTVSFGACFRCAGSGTIVRHEPAKGPPTLSSCLALGADPSGIERAEVLARTLAARLAPWGVGAVARTRIAWRFGVPAPPQDWLLRCPPPFDAVCEALKSLLHDPDLPSRGAMAERWAEAGAMAWEAAVDLGPRGRVPHGPGVGVAIVGRTFQDLEDPFDPFLELRETGYGLDSLGKEGIVLVAPDEGLD
jgi:uncharacterized protein (TIGR02996 family)